MAELTSSEIEQALREAIAKEMELAPEAIDLDASLRDDLDINSLDATNILMVLEDRFQVEADLETFFEMQTARDVLGFLEGTLGRTHGAAPTVSE